MHRHRGTDSPPRLCCILRGKGTFHKANNFALDAAPSGPFPGLALLVRVLSGSLWTHVPKVPSGVKGPGTGTAPGVPVTRSSAVLVACPDPLVALRENRPLLAFVAAGIVSLARPSLKEICTPGSVDVEIAWPSRNQLTSGTGKPGEKTVHRHVGGRGGHCQVLCASRHGQCLVLTAKGYPGRRAP